MQLPFVSVIIYNMKKIISMISVILLLLGISSCAAAPVEKQRFSTSFLDLFDTASTVIAYDESQELFNEHFQQFYDKLAEYDKLYDIYKSYDGLTNLYTLNREAKDGPVKVDKKIIDLLEYCKYAYDLSGGKTNICFGSVLELWHDSREYAKNNPDDAKIPDMKALTIAAKHTNFESLVIDRENSTVYFSDPDLRLDVGAVAKGYAVREVSDWARDNLWSSAAISIGGNISTIGYKNDDGKTPWNIGLENPEPDVSDYLYNLNITDMSVVISGDYQRYFIADGKKYCHIIDPDTLLPAEYVASVAVVCEDSALGDVLSTTLFNMSVEDGMKLVESIDGVEAVWVTPDYERHLSKGFEKYIAAQ